MTSSFFNPVSIIEKKKRGNILSKEEIEKFVLGAVNGSVEKYQLSAWLMAVRFMGMKEKEIFDLTEIMVNSGTTLDFGDLPTADKHSTGGVGDKTSFIIAPIVAACGYFIPMIAGRGLGHTGGTIDKLESIDGYNTQLSFSEFKKQVQSIGASIIGQTESLAPADRLLYSVRDVTATIDSIPLITSSILSKKLAEGAQNIVFDIKYGSGAFLRDSKQGKILGDTIKSVVSHSGKKASYYLTDMNSPLGDFAGHVVEIHESLQVLKNSGNEKLREVSLVLAGKMIDMVSGGNDGKKRAQKVLENGKAYEKFEEMVAAQGGNLSSVDQKMKKLKCTEFITEKSGPLLRYDALKLGNLLCTIGGGRTKSADKIDHSIGFEFLCEAGNSLERGRPVLKVYSNQEVSDDLRKYIFKASEDALILNDNQEEIPKLIL